MGARAGLGVPCAAAKKRTSDSERGRRGSSFLRRRQTQAGHRRRRRWCCRVSVVCEKAEEERGDGRGRRQCQRTPTTKTEGRWKRRRDVPTSGLDVEVGLGGCGGGTLRSRGRRGGGRRFGSASRARGKGPVLGPEEAGHAVGAHVFAGSVGAVGIAVAEALLPAGQGVVEGGLEVDAGPRADLLVEVAREGRGRFVAGGALPADEAEPGVSEALQDVVRQAVRVARVQETQLEAVAQLQHLDELLQPRRLRDVPVLRVPRARRGLAVVVVVVVVVRASLLSATAAVLQPIPLLLLRRVPGRQAHEAVLEERRGLFVRGGACQRRRRGHELGEAGHVFGWRQREAEAVFVVVGEARAVGRPHQTTFLAGAALLPAQPPRRGLDAVAGEVEDARFEGLALRRHESLAVRRRRRVLLRRQRRRAHEVFIVAAQQGVDDVGGPAGRRDDLALRRRNGVDHHFDFAHELQLVGLGHLDDAVRPSGFLHEQLQRRAEAREDFDGLPLVARQPLQYLHHFHPVPLRLRRPRARALGLVVRRRRRRPVRLLAEVRRRRRPLRACHGQPARLARHALRRRRPGEPRSRSLLFARRDLGELGGLALQPQHQRRDALAAVVVPRHLGVVGRGRVVDVVDVVLRRRHRRRRREQVSSAERRRRRRDLPTALRRRSFVEARRVAQEPWTVAA
mmetsp:Transcript_29202/g.89331  ORF Transcript_29202/g.89331 Transcript_29202/m.89331 type:complete len:680 (+) Transcript_29202:162-2201(+)